MSNEKKNILIYSFSGLIILILITFSGAKNHDRKVKSVDISIEQEDGNFFTDKLEVMDLMTLGNTDFIIGSEFSYVNPKTLEERVKANPFVKDAQVFRNLKGHLEVRVVQSKPIARVFIDGKNDKYIDTEGNILPINARHTARVPLVETAFPFSWKTNLHETNFGVDVFQLLKFIEREAFWKAQIAHVIIQKDGEIKLFPQVTKQTIEFGYPKELDVKFNKLMIFYKEILPIKGWNEYNRVNLKFEDQIICE